MSEVVVAEREFRCSNSAARIRVFAPKPDRRDWRCEYEIAWPGAPRRSYAMGVDSFQALQLAMLKISTDIGASEEFKAGVLTIFDEPLTTEAHVVQLFPVPWNTQQ